MATVVDGVEGLREYFGSPDDVVDFVGGAKVLVTHLAPLPRSVFARLAKLRLVAVARGGPVNIDMAAAREFGVGVVNAPGRNAPPSQNSRSARSSPRRATSSPATRLCAPASGAAISIAPTGSGANSTK